MLGFNHQLEEFSEWDFHGAKLMGFNFKNHQQKCGVFNWHIYIYVICMVNGQYIYIVNHVEYHTARKPYVSPPSQT